MKRKGISLIVLIITIVVIIILATAIIVNVAQTNIIENANEAVVKQDFRTMQDELNMYISDKYMNALGKYDPKKLNADKDNIWYDNEKQEGNITNIIPSMKGTKYEGKLFVKEGKLVFDIYNITEKEKEWAEEIGILAGNDTPPDITGKVDIKLSTYDYTPNDIDIELVYSNIPSGYEIEYRYGSNLTWTSYTEKFSISKNTTVYARLYNKTLDDEAATNSKNINLIDKTAPYPASITINDISNGYIDGRISLDDNIGISYDSFYIVTTESNYINDFEYAKNYYTVNYFSYVYDEYISYYIETSDTYYIHVFSIDYAGNWTETISEPIEYTTGASTGGSVTIDKISKDTINSGNYILTSTVTKLNDHQGMYYTNDVNSFWVITDYYEDIGIENAKTNYECHYDFSSYGDYDESTGLWKQTIYSNVTAEQLEQYFELYIHVFLEDYDGNVTEVKSSINLSNISFETESEKFGYCGRVIINDMTLNSYNMYDDLTYSYPTSTTYNIDIYETEWSEFTIDYNNSFFICNDNIVSDIYDIEYVKQNYVCNYFSSGNIVIPTSATYVHLYAYDNNGNGYVVAIFYICEDGFVRVESLI